MFASFAQDLRYAVRSLRSAPVFALVAIASLALGIGANTAIFSVVDGILLKPLALPDPDRLVVLGEADANSGPTNFSSTSAANVLEWQRASTTMRIAAYRGAGGTLTGNGEPAQVFGAGVLGGFFEVAGERPVIGRAVTVADESPASERVIVLSHAMWMGRFGGSRSIIDSTITLNGTPRRVIGVMSPSFRFPDASTEFWVPLRLTPEERANRDQYSFQPIGRLRPGTTIEQARADMAVIAARLKQEWPAFNADLQIGVYPLTETIVGGIRRQLLLLMGAVALVLLITCANLGNLLLARATSRVRELAVRQAIGADRRRLTQQLFTESLTLSLTGALAGVLVGWVFLSLILRAQPMLNLPRTGEVSLDFRVLVFTMAIGVLAGLFFGMFPVWQLGRAHVSEALRSGARGATAGHRVARGTLVVAQLAFTMLLLTGAGLLMKSFSRLQRVDPGFTEHDLITFDVSPARSTEQFFAIATERLRAMRGVRAVARIDQLPLTGRGGGAWFNRMDRALPAGQTPSGEIYRTVTPDFFSTIGIGLKHGRFLTTADGPGAPAVVVNQALVDRYYPGEDPLGKRIYLGTPNNRIIDNAAIVGVVANTHDTGMATGAPPIVYLSTANVPGAASFSFVIRADGDPESLIAGARRIVRELDPNVALRNVRTMEMLLSESLAPARWSMTLLGVFALVALVISVVGVFGVLSFLVAQRTREMGIRLALGASPGGVRRLVLGNALRLIAVGVSLGLVASFAMTRLMSGLLFEVEPSDWPTYVAVSALLVLMGLLASYLPARRATLIDATVALRSE